jgi:hypothetical protein
MRAVGGKIPQIVQDVDGRRRQAEGGESGKGHKPLMLGDWIARRRNTMGQRQRQQEQQVFDPLVRPDRLENGGGT